MKACHAILIVAVTLFFLSSPGRAEVYKYVDKRGTVHYTDDPDQLPEPQRSKVLRELEEQIKKERERRERLKKEGIDLPNERLPPPPSQNEDGWKTPPPPRPQNSRHPAADRLESRQASKKKWQALGNQARERVAALEKKCAELKTKRDHGKRDRFIFVQPGAGQRYQKALAAYQRCQKELESARDYLEVQLPEQARKSGVPPGWIR